MVVPWTDVDGLYMDSPVIGLYMGDADSDTWGSNLMDYEIITGDDGTVVVPPNDNTDLKVVVQNRFSAGDMSLMSNYPETYIHIRENISLEASDVSGGYRFYVPD